MFNAFELIRIFCAVDDFCKDFIPVWQKQQVASGVKHRNKPAMLTAAEIMTVVIWFHRSCFRTFKDYYQQDAATRFRHWFHKDLPSYSRMVELMGSVLVPLMHFLGIKRGKSKGVAFVDSTTLQVCDNKRINRHKVFKGLAARGKTSMGWFFGFKLHLVVNECGDIVSLLLTPGNVADNDKDLGLQLMRRLLGKVFGDRGYISHELTEALYANGVQLITGIRRNMKNRLMKLVDKLLLRKRSIIETINDLLKNSEQIEHSRHRSPTNFLVNLFSGLISYQLEPKKPSIFQANELMALA